MHRHKATKHFQTLLNTVPVDVIPVEMMQRHFIILGPLKHGCDTPVRTRFKRERVGQYERIIASKQLFMTVATPLPALPAAQ
jgi:hypothetical protein